MSPQPIHRDLRLAIQRPTDMSKTKYTLLLLLAVFVHFSLTLTLAAVQMSCGIQSGCGGVIGAIGGLILGFPLNIVLRIVFPAGVQAGGSYYLLMMLNSLAFVCISWFVLIRPLISRILRRS